MEIKESKIKSEQGVSVRTAAPGCHSKHSAHIPVSKERTRIILTLCYRQPHSRN